MLGCKSAPFCTMKDQRHQYICPNICFSLQNVQNHGPQLKNYPFKQHFQCFYMTQNIVFIKCPTTTSHACSHEISLPAWVVIVLQFHIQSMRTDFHSLEGSEKMSTDIRSPRFLTRNNPQIRQFTTMKNSRVNMSRVLCIRHSSHYFSHFMFSRYNIPVDLQNLSVPLRLFRTFQDVMVHT